AVNYSSGKSDLVNLSVDTGPQILPPLLLKESDTKRENLDVRGALGAPIADNPDELVSLSDNVKVASSVANENDSSSSVAQNTEVQIAALPDKVERTAAINVSAIGGDAIAGNDAVTVVAVENKTSLSDTIVQESRLDNSTKPMENSKFIVDNANNLFSTEVALADIAIAQAVSDNVGVNVGGVKDQDRSDVVKEDARSVVVGMNVDSEESDEHKSNVDVSKSVFTSGDSTAIDMEVDMEVQDPDNGNTDKMTIDEEKSEPSSSQSAVDLISNSDLVSSIVSDKVAADIVADESGVTGIDSSNKVEQKDDVKSDDRAENKVEEKNDVKSDDRAEAKEVPNVDENIASKISSSNNESAVTIDVKSVVGGAGDDQSSKSFISSDEPKSDTVVPVLTEAKNSNDDSYATNSSVTSDTVFSASSSTDVNSGDRITKTNVNSDDQIVTSDANSSDQTTKSDHESNSDIGKFSDISRDTTVSDLVSSVTTVVDDISSTPIIGDIVGDATKAAISSDNFSAPISNDASNTTTPDDTSNTTILNDTSNTTLLNDTFNTNNPNVTFSSVSIPNDTSNDTISNDNSKVAISSDTLLTAPSSTGAASIDNAANHSVNNPTDEPTSVKSIDTVSVDTSSDNTPAVTPANSTVFDATNADTLDRKIEAETNSDKSSEGLIKVNADDAVSTGISTVETASKSDDENGQTGLIDDRENVAVASTELPRATDETTESPSASDKEVQENSSQPMETKNTSTKDSPAPRAKRDTTVTNIHNNSTKRPSSSFKRSPANLSKLSRR
ncbi:hypothetical protein KPH14_013121, partial [Odynerus spinipes]